MTGRLRSGWLLVWCGAVLGASCGGEPPSLPPLADVLVTLPDFDSIPVQLSDGEGEVVTDGGAIILRAGLTDWTAIENMDEDDALEAVAVVWSSGGGSGSFMDLAAFDLQEGVWVWRGSVALGDRVRVRVLAVSGDEVTLQLTEHGPDDPMCCPTVRAERRYRLVAAGFEVMTTVDRAG